MGYVHSEILSIQTSKKPGTPCGDLAVFERTAAATTLVVCDGLGSGIKANLAAQLSTSRLMELLRCGFSLRESFAHLVRSMHESRSSGLPYAVFTVVRILVDGEATILTYEMPPPIFVGAKHATILPQRSFPLEGELAAESTCFLEPGEGILVVSDGITHSGMGMRRGLPMGWGSEGLLRFVNDHLADRFPIPEIPDRVHEQARLNWGGPGGDDCTAVMALCRSGNILNILTGPPINTDDDVPVVNRFLHSEGRKVICGASTAKIVARRMGRKLEVDTETQSAIEPPRYLLDGIDLVTEGAVTLNQAYNLLSEDLPPAFADSPVGRLYDLLKSSDRINISVGRATNPASADISFRQQGILPRARIVPLIANTLTNWGKLVVLEYH